MDNRPIGMFDSGVGGMTVFSEIIKQLPNEDIIYYGDTKRFPYGNKSKESIIELSKKATEFLISKNVKCIIIACGTATSQAIETLQNEYSIPIIGIIEPTALYIKKNKNIKNLGIIATRGTINSKAWETKIKTIRSDINIKSKACPVLAQIAEEGWTDNKIAEDVLRDYLKNLTDIDSLVLGCTHYPLFENTINQIYKNKVELINTGEKISFYLRDKLTELKMLNEENHTVNHKFYLSDTESNFITIANTLLQGKYIISNVENIETI